MNIEKSKGEQLELFLEQEKARWRMTSKEPIWIDSPALVSTVLASRPESFETEAQDDLQSGSMSLSTLFRVPPLPMTLSLTSSKTLPASQDSADSGYMSSTSRVMDTLNLTNFHMKQQAQGSERSSEEDHLGTGTSTLFDLSLFPTAMSLASLHPGRIENGIDIQPYGQGCGTTAATDETPRTDFVLPPVHLLPPLPPKTLP
ncbi:uncharacterized protein JCM15063_000243 [Sporobolomyces koalae]|uniref:uncharacterized protein n=1 Tax=Sporobolomyces koalae TaxID=500713 RepID=UPI00317AA863